MAIQSKQLIFEQPKRPISEVFVYRHVVDPYEFRMLKDQVGYMKALKRRMAGALADMIVERCQLFQLPSEFDIYRGVPVQMECVINDRGSYENWLPNERRKGREEGREQGKKQVVESLPYGYEPNQYWE